MAEVRPEFHDVIDRNCVSVQKKRAVLIQRSMAFLYLATSLFIISSFLFRISHFICVPFAFRLFITLLVRASTTELYKKYDQN